jgi:hypothetical protein
MDYAAVHTGHQRLDCRSGLSWCWLIDCDFSRALELPDTERHIWDCVSTSAHTAWSLPWIFSSVHSLFQRNLIIDCCSTSPIWRQKTLYMNFKRVKCSAKRITNRIRNIIVTKWSHARAPRDGGIALALGIIFVEIIKTYEIPYGWDFYLSCQFKGVLCSTFPDLLFLIWHFVNWDQKTILNILELIQHHLER